MKSTGLTPVMYKLLVGPMAIGILAFLAIYFISPVIIAEADMVAVFADFSLGLANVFFANMPPVVSSYISNLNLTIVAITAGLCLTVVIQLLVIIWSMFIYPIRWIVAFLQREKKQEAPQELPPIDMDSSFKSSESGEKVQGRGFDSIDRD